MCLVLHINVGIFCSATSCVHSPVWAPGLENMAHSVSWLEVVKGVPDQGVDCSVS